MTERQAIYSEQVLSEFKGNPLIEALPPIWDSSEVVDMLSHSDGHHDGERQLDARYRMHCVLRLFRYFQPLEQHLDIDERFSLCIRQGYLHRNPLLPDYARGLVEGHNAIKSGEYVLPVAYNPTGSGFTIIGLSGVGKTSAITRILSLYPQVIVHSRYKETPLVLKQVVWLKIDCPHDGLVKGLCMEFFEAVDRAAGTNYFELYVKRGSTINISMKRMEQIARLHCVGVLVIPISEEFKASLYNESQGIVDIAVKLYAMAQIRAIGLQEDTFGPNDLRIVASEKLGLVKPALDALRSGNKKRIAAIGDIAPISIDDYYAAYSAMLPPTAENITVKRNETSLAEQAVLKLMELDVKPTTAKTLVGKVMATHMELRKVGEIVKIAYQLYLAKSTQNTNEDGGCDENDLRYASNYDAMKSTGAVSDAEW
jgi:hypothetical protein